MGEWLDLIKTYHISDILEILEIFEIFENNKALKEKTFS